MKTEEQGQKAQEAVAGHYSQLLGIESPWQVKRVEVNLPLERVLIEVSWATPGTCES